MPGNVTPASTINMLPETYAEESWIRYRTSEVNAGSEVPNVLKGAVLKATFVNQSFCIRASVISDLKSPGDIEFTLILCTPNSKAITWIFSLSFSILQDKTNAN
ncbi:hypothetical protein SLEP1_g27834 [Rubroshorea leprosula]|uniref:Uncharacterized protein n=1 Tax=Rubroshorea leprosula TaxID=152421 RepID=A0AAV5JRU1_9ROSI|nr:hypothetical protein SLEP1_g27834 [Rubroshorea leprosula]